ncbi:MAG: redoxin domain-containing protein [Candidatus Fermentibacteraceae bacterium]|nr:redoxin domain-containing protein [Candidatus Fermentibacteraceae bacterium]
MIKQLKRELKDSKYKRYQLKSIVFFAAGVVVLAMIAGYFFKQSPARPPAGRADIASDFPEGTWFNTAEPLSLYDQLRGHVVVVLFNDFNTLSDLEDLSRFSELDSLFINQPMFGIVVLAGRETTTADSLVRQWQIDCPVLADPDSQAMQTFGIRALPAVLVLDARARVAARYYEDWQRIPIEAVIQDLLDQGVATRSLAAVKYVPRTVDQQ